MHFQNATVLIPYLDSVSNFVGYGFVEAMLEPYLRHSSDMSPSDVTNAFVIIGVLYLASMLLFGWLCDKIGHPTAISVCGNVLMAAALLLLGPAPFLNLDLTKTMVFVCSTLIGIGYAQIAVSTFARSYNAALRCGFAEDIKTFLVVAGKTTNDS